MSLLRALGIVREVEDGEHARRTQIVRGAAAYGQIVVLLALGTSLGWSQEMKGFPKSPWVRWEEKGHGVVLYYDAMGKVVRGQCEEGDDALRELCKYPSTTILTCVGSSITDDGMWAVAALKNLRKLDLFGTSITGKGLAVLPKLQELEYLICDPKHDRELAFEYIGQCSSLATLQLSSERGFPGKSLEHLTKLPKLRKLTISENPVRDEDLQFLEKIPSLREFSCECENLTDRACAILAECQNLEYICIGNAPITDEGVKSLAQIKHLRELNISGTKVRGPGLAALANCPSLEELSLDGLPIEDSHLEPLWKSNSLKAISLIGTKVTAEGVKKLHQRLKLDRFHTDEAVRAELRRQGIVKD